MLFLSIFVGTLTDGAYRVIAISRAGTCKKYAAKTTRHIGAATKP